MTKGLILPPFYRRISTIHRTSFGVLTGEGLDSKLLDHQIEVTGAQINYNIDI